MRKPLLLTLLLLAPLIASYPPVPDDHLLGDWNGFRTAAANRGLDLKASYWNDVQGNPTGGRNQALANAAALYVTAEADLCRLLNLWPGLSLFASTSYWTGRNLSQDIGNQFTVSAWWAPTTYYLDELYLEQAFSYRNTLIRAGRMCADIEFASSPLFINYITLAINYNPISFYFDTPFPADPFALWAAYFQTDLTPFLTFKAGAYNGVEGVLDKTYHGFNWSFRTSGGVMLMGQLDLTHRCGTYRFGAYYVTGRHPLFLGGSATGNHGFYTVCDQQLLKTTCRTLYAWGMGLVAKDDRNKLPYFFATGLVLEHPKDHTNLGFAFGSFSGQLRTEISGRVRRGLVGQITTDPKTYEAVLELNHWFYIRPGLYLTPLAQWIINPGATSTLPDALVLGFQLTAIL